MVSRAERSPWRARFLMEIRNPSWRPKQNYIRTLRQKLNLTSNSFVVYWYEPFLEGAPHGTLLPVLLMKIFIFWLFCLPDILLWALIMRGWSVGRESNPGLPYSRPLHTVF
jgi:hypothetical protein